MRKPNCPILFSNLKLQKKHLAIKMELLNSIFFQNREKPPTIHGICRLAGALFAGRCLRLGFLLGRPDHERSVGWLNHFVVLPLRRRLFRLLGGNGESRLFLVALKGQFEISSWFVKFRSCLFVKVYTHLLLNAVHLSLPGESDVDDGTLLQTIAIWQLSSEVDFHKTSI